MFKRVFEVTFLVIQNEETYTGPDDEQSLCLDDGEEDAEELEVSAMVVVDDTSSLLEFTARLAVGENLKYIIEGLGYAASEFTATVVKVEDVSDVHNVVMFPKAVTH